VNTFHKFIIPQNIYPIFLLGGTKKFMNFAEPAGFEPARGFEAPASLAKMYVRPL
jgi:hypothetical protein